MKRYYLNHIKKYQDRKITLISGPRQSGKTTMSKMLGKNFDYLNYDSIDDQIILKESAWDRSKELVILDEVHKMKNWKQWLKGIYDTEGNTPNLIVTGSARMDTYRKVGDSLAGRYFHYRMHPLDIRELYTLDPSINIEETIEQLLQMSGFPEPYLENDVGFYNRWKKTHLDIILRQDLIETQSITDIKAIELLMALLQKRVASPLSYKSFSEDVCVSDKTIKKWISILTDSYICFIITPWSKNVARSIKKQPKLYFFDNARVLGDEGIRIENLVATTLIKEVQYKNDCYGRELELHYVAKQGGNEIDFAISENEEVKLLIEVKNSEDNPSKNFRLFEKDFPEVKKIQLVRHLKREKTYPDGLEIRSLGNWLAHIDL
jgi:predicted AAA+ superfamily ATPase